MVPLDPAERAEGPPEGERRDDERQPEAEAVGQREQRAAARGGLRERQGLHGGQGRPDARRPADAEDDAEHRRPGEPDRRLDVETELPPRQPRHQAGEDEAEDDREDPDDLGETLLVFEQLVADVPEEGTHGDEDGGEAEHEQQRAGEHPAAPRLLEVGAADPRDVAEVSGHQRQDARGEERHEAPEEGHGHREQQRAAENRLVVPVHARVTPPRGRA